MSLLVDVIRRLGAPNVPYCGCCWGGLRYIVHEATLFHINLDILLFMSTRNRSPTSLINLRMMEPASFLFCTFTFVGEQNFPNSGYLLLISRQNPIEMFYLSGVQSNIVATLINQ